MYSDTLYVYVLGLSSIIAYGGNDNPWDNSHLLSSARNLHPSQHVIDQYYPEFLVVVSIPFALWTSTSFL